MKYFDISKEVILALKKSFFSKCTLNFLTKFVVTSKLKYFFLADRYYALRGYNTWPLAPKRYIITNQAPLFSLMLCNFRKNKYLFNVNKYRTRAIISRGLYIFYPIFIDYFFLFFRRFIKKILYFYVWLMTARVWYTRMSKLLTEKKI